MQRHAHLALHSTFNLPNVIGHLQQIVVPDLSRRDLRIYQMKILTQLLQESVSVQALQKNVTLRTKPVVTDSTTALTGK